MRLMMLERHMPTTSNYYYQLNFAALHRHLVVYVTVSIACKKFNVPTMGAPLKLHGSLAAAAQ
jgi:hypothetical protein